MSHGEMTRLTGSLEDYLETIYLLIRDRKVARVKDIAEARDVRMASVTPAMRRLAELGYIHYQQREFIELTPAGEEVARRTMARHDLLRRFFHEILQVPADTAEQDACAVEHHLSDESMERLVRFFEFQRLCPRWSGQFLKTFHGCSAIHPDLQECPSECEFKRRSQGPAPADRIGRLSDVPPGDECHVVQVTAKGAVRQRLIDMGMLPGTRVTVERKGPGGNPIWIRMKGFQLSLRKGEAAGIDVTA